MKEGVNSQVEGAKRIQLFLDYDGTLAEFAPTPDDVIPDSELIDIVTQLVEHPDFRVSIVSGRRLSHIRKLIPVTGVLLAGTYGIELLTPQGEEIHRLDYTSIRPHLEAIKPVWANLIDQREGFFLEDKGWTLAIHARFASETHAQKILPAAEGIARESIPMPPFRLLGGHRFLEVSPVMADKGKTIEYLLARFAWDRALPVYMGDDDKDEGAFAVIKSHNGVAILVAAQDRVTYADFRLSSAQEARLWLRSALEGVHASPGKENE